VASSARLLVIELDVAFFAQVAVAAGRKDDRARLSLAGRAAVALDVHSVHALSLEGRRVRDLLGGVLPPETLPKEPGYRTPHPLQEPLDAPDGPGGQKEEEGGPEEAAKAKGYLVPSQLRDVVRDRPLLYVAERLRKHPFIRSLMVGKETKDLNFVALIDDLRIPIVEQLLTR